MAKNKTEKVDGEVQPETISQNELSSKEEPRYRMVPVDQVTHKRLMKLCAARGFGQRGQGAMVRILINSSYEAEFSNKKKT